MAGEVMGPSGGDTDVVLLNGHAIAATLPSK